MRFLKAVAVIGTFASGALGLAGTPLASPLASGAMPSARSGGDLVARTQLILERRVSGPHAVPGPEPSFRPFHRPGMAPGPHPSFHPIRRPRRVLGPHPSFHPVYRPRTVVRYGPLLGPRPVLIRYHPVYRPVRVVRPRTVCRTRIRLIRTAYGDLVRRSVRRCTRRY